MDERTSKRASQSPRAPSPAHSLFPSSPNPHPLIRSLLTPSTSSPYPHPLPPHSSPPKSPKPPIPLPSHSLTLSHLTHHTSLLTLYPSSPNPRIPFTPPPTPSRGSIP